MSICGKKRLFFVKYTVVEGLGVKIEVGSAAQHFPGGISNVSAAECWGLHRNMLSLKGRK